MPLSLGRSCVFGGRDHRPVAVVAGRDTGAMVAELPGALSRYARRVHACAGDRHHVVSPLGAWLVLALCGPLGGHPGADGLAEVLGMSPAEAFEAAEALLDDPHPLVELAAAVWARPRAETSAWRRWQAGLPDAVGRGDIPSQEGLDAWAREHTLGLIGAFPLRRTPEVVVVLATAVATRVSWAKPFAVVDASQLGPHGPWTQTLRRVLRAPIHDPRHRQYLCDTPEAGLVGVHVADARGGVVVGSVIAVDPSVPAGPVLAAAEEIVTADARERNSISGRSLFDLSVGDQPTYSITEEAVETTAAEGREERLVSVLPAWSASTELALGDEALGFPAAARILGAALDLDECGYAAAQSAVARYSAVGFEAAAVTGMFTASSAPRYRPGLRRTATIRFAHPYAVVAATATDRRPANPSPGRAWHGLPVFSAWITDPTDADGEPSG